LASDGVLVLATGLLLLVCNLLSERVPVGDGFGWDGVQYGAWARDFYTEIASKGVDSYYIQRILPSAVVHYSLRALRRPLSDTAILRAFGLYGVALLTLASWAWCDISRRLRLSLAAKWLGFVAFFVNYIALKYIHYVPPGTESTAYSVGVFMLWAYLSGRSALLLAVILAGAFDWPAVVPIGALLLIFPHRDAASCLRLPRAVPRVIAAGLAIAVGAGIWTTVRTAPRIVAVFIDPAYAEPYRPLLFFSVMIAAAYAGFGAYPLLDDNRLFDPGWLFARRRVVRATLVAASAIALRVAQDHLSRPAAFTPATLLMRQTAYTAVVRPGIFLVTHVAFYGPMFIIAIFTWKRTCHHLKAAGVGVTLATLFGLLLSLNSQSRFTISIIPLVLPFVIKAVDELNWRAPQYGLVTVSSVVLSKIWFRITTGPFHGNLREFPDQGFFMTHGPWISPPMYAIQGAAFAVMAAAIYVVCLAGRTSHIRLTPEPDSAAET